MVSLYVRHRKRAEGAEMRAVERLLSTRGLDNSSTILRGKNRLESSYNGMVVVRSAPHTKCDRLRADELCLFKRDTMRNLVHTWRDFPSGARKWGQYKCRFPLAGPEGMVDPVPYAIYAPQRPVRCGNPHNRHYRTSLKAESRNPGFVTAF